MKTKFFAFVAILFSLAMTSCQKDSADMIVGNWKLDVNKSTVREILPSADGGSFDETISMYETGVASALFSFGKDGILKMEVSYWYIWDGDFGEFAYSINDDLLVIDEYDEYTITELDKNDLVLDNHFVDQDGYENYKHLIFTRTE